MSRIIFACRAAQVCLALVTAGVVAAGAVSAADTEAEGRKSKNGGITAKTEIELTKEFPEFFKQLEGKELMAPPFRAGESGEVVIYFEEDHALASLDEGRTWQVWNGKRNWPADDNLGVFRVGDELVSISNGSSVRRSTDNGYTWTEPQAIQIAKDERYPNLRGPYVFSIEVTGKGRIIIPEDYLVGREGPDPDVLYSNVSDDAGRTWRRSPIIEPPKPLPNAPEGFGEPAVVELADGACWMVFRSLYGHLWQCLSTDGGLTWGSPCSTGLASPLSNVKAERIPGTDAVVLIWNNAVPGASRDFNANPGIYRPRSPLVFAVSHDNCRSWTCPVTIYGGTGIYPQVCFSEKSMFVTYQSNPDPGVGAGASYGLTLSVYDRQEVLNLPPWTAETIKPYVADGRVAHWLTLNARPE